MQQNGVFDLLKMLELSIDESFPIIPGRYVVVKPKEIETLIDRIYASLPVEVQHEHSSDAEMNCRWKPSKKRKKL